MFQQTKKVYSRNFLVLLYFSLRIKDPSLGLRV